MSKVQKVSVVIPARNEEAYIGDCLRSILASASHAKCKVELVVVLNRSDDSTESITREFSARIVKDDSRNLSKIRNVGIRASSSEYVVTIDADSRMSLNLISEICKRFDSGRYLAGGTMIYTERFSPGIVLTGVAVWAYLIFKRITVGCFYFSREIFDEIGGFDEGLITAEDLDFAVRLRDAAKQKGKSFANIYRASIITSCRKFDRFGDWYMIANPIVTLRLFQGRSQELGDRFWYKVDRD